MSNMPIEDMFRLALDRHALGNFDKDFLIFGDPAKAAQLADSLFAIAEQKSCLAVRLGEISDIHACADVLAFTLKDNGICDSWEDIGHLADENGSFSFYFLDEILENAGKIARTKNSVLVLHAEKADKLDPALLGELLAAKQRCNGEALPVVLMLSGGNTLVRKAGKAKDYAERMFYIVDA